MEKQILPSLQQITAEFLRTFDPRHKGIFFILFFASLVSSGIPAVNAQQASCPVLEHNSFTNFNASSNPGTETTLWFNLHTKLTNAQLSNNGDYLLFAGGTLTFNGIGTSFGTTTSIPTGKIIADNTVSIPSTSFDNPTNTWITRVPPGYSSSDIFISGAAVTSSTGFTLSGGGKSTILSGNFFSNKSISSSWFYGMACYQPGFNNSNTGSVNPVSGIPVNGRKAGTPNDQETGMVAGGSGGGGSNFTGSYSSTDNFSSCLTPPDDGPPEKRGTDDSGIDIFKTSLSRSFPNPFNGTTNITYALENNANVILKIYSITGKEITTLVNAEETAGEHSLQWNSAGYPGGIYILKLNAGSYMGINKLVVIK